eukprot:CAMPEP_0201727636 /NCGR_PEP_ID=MMETSP0593-20130828/13073_1 /ASSEMBLY_ACC=CAM_ASM_000672 /TAXON_ID=267983 /ORGANISM="Skeletonema japonicum, Strain CCMP2506" /LENGTH=88 /DNA_ID=CAMNT_0048219507 /DNA_START=1 /DNA_END=264 /DNA_ORIENTATION=+
MSKLDTTIATNDDTTNDDYHSHSSSTSTHKSFSTNANNAVEKSQEEEENDTNIAGSPQGGDPMRLEDHYHSPMINHRHHSSTLSLRMD